MFHSPKSFCELSFGNFFLIASEWNSPWEKLLRAMLFQGSYQLQKFETKENKIISESFRTGSSTGHFLPKTLSKFAFSSKIYFSLRHSFKLETSMILFLNLNSCNQNTTLLMFRSFTGITQIKSWQQEQRTSSNTLRLFFSRPWAEFELQNTKFSFAVFSDKGKDYLSDVIRLKLTLTRRLTVVTCGLL